jgi:uncharacterized membrane protein HdeD (DUF308 family)
MGAAMQRMSKRHWIASLVFAAIVAAPTYLAFGEPVFTISVLIAGVVIYGIVWLLGRILDELRAIRDAVDRDRERD